MEFFDIRYCVEVNCRIGSLETNLYSYKGHDFVNCRIGSLEKIQKLYRHV